MTWDADTSFLALKWAGLFLLGVIVWIAVGLLQRHARKQKPEPKPPLDWEEYNSLLDGNRPGAASEEGSAGQ